MPNSDKRNAFALPPLTLDVPRGTAAQRGYRGLGKECKGRCCLKFSQQLKAGFTVFGCHFFISSNGSHEYYLRDTLCIKNVTHATLVRQLNKKGYLPFQFIHD
jgi:hypothetical protein